MDIIENNGTLAVEDVRRLWRSVGWNWYEGDDGYERTTTALNDPRCTTLLAREGDSIIGLLHAMDNGFTAYLCYLVVDPAHQGRGIGKALIEAFDEKFFDFHREVMADNSASGFYRACGYGHDGEYTAMAKWACERKAPQIGDGDWSESAYSAYRNDRRPARNENERKA